MAIAYERAWRGVDRRRPRGSAGKGALWGATNAHITRGLTVLRRPPFRFEHDCSEDIIGLAASGGKLHGWHGKDPAPDAMTYPAAEVFTLHDVRIAMKELSDILFAGQIANQLYVVAQYTDGAVQHWYADATVTNADCPQTSVVAIAGNRVFAVGAAPNVDYVRFSKAEDPTDWSGVDDAGFLPTGRASGGRGEPTALGGWRDNLAVFYADQVQLWYVGIDPTTDHRLVDTIGGIGCTHPETVVEVESTLFFLSARGYRALIPDPDTGRAKLVEVGAEIDKLVQDPERLTSDRQRAVYWEGGGLYLNLRRGSNADVLSYSEEPKVKGWSDYTFPTTVDHPAAMEGKVFLRNTESGAIVSMDASQEFTTDFRDQTGPSVTVEQPTLTLDNVAAAFPARLGPEAVIYQDGSTPRGNTGPSENNLSGFARWPVLADSGDAATLRLSDVLTRPRARAEPVELEIEYSAQGDYPAAAGAWLQVSAEDVGDDDWQTIGVFAGWPWAATRRASDLVVDAREAEFYCSLDGGWRKGRLLMPESTRRARLRISAEEGGDPSQSFIWGRRRPTADVAMTYVTSRTVVPARQPTNLAAAVVFVGLPAGPGFYVPGLGGGDVPARLAGEAAEANEASEAHQLATGGTYSAAAASLAVTDLDPITTADHLTFTIAADGYIPAGDLPFAPVAGEKWHETYARSLSAFYDEREDELLVVSGNGREWHNANARARVRIMRFDMSAGNEGTRLLPDMLVDVRAADKYDASVGVFWIAGDADRWYVASEGRREVTVFNRGMTNGAVLGAAVRTIAYPVEGDTVSGIGAYGGSFYLMTFPDRAIYRYHWPFSRWLTGPLDARVMQGRSHLVARDSRLWAYDASARTMRAWETYALPDAATADGIADFCIRSVKATANPALSYRTQVLGTYLSHGDDARKKDVRGVRIDQVGRSEYRTAFRNEDGSEEATAWQPTSGDSTSGPMVPVGVVSAEVAPEFLIEHDGPWELSVLGYEVSPLTTWW